MGLRLLVVFLGASLLSFAQSTAPTVYRIGGDVKSPTILYRTEPQYSDEARKAKLQGTVLLSLVVNDDGTPRDLRVIRSLGLGLDENAVAAVSQWKFEPSIINGTPVAVQCNIEVSYHLLLDPKEWYPSQVALSAPQGATEPRFLSAPPHVPSAAVNPARMRLSFDIDAEGHPMNIHIEDSSDHSADDEVMAMIMQWRFQAALDHGLPVESHGVIDLTRGLLQEVPRPVEPPRKKQQLAH